MSVATAPAPTPAPAPVEATRLLAGIGVTMLGVFVFACSNALAKWLTGGYPVGQILFARSLVVLCILACVIRPADVRAMREGGQPWLHAWRAMLSAVELSLIHI